MSYETGFFGIPGSRRKKDSTDVHVVLNGRPICGVPVRAGMEFFRSAVGFVESIVECGRCKRVLHPPGQTYNFNNATDRYRARAAGLDVPKRPCGLKPKPFDAHVRKAEGDGCWEWTGNKVCGYGSWQLHGRSWRAHRYAWERANGRPVPDGLVVMHKCDNRACVRPDHLEIGTQLDNRRDAVKKGRTARGEKVSNTGLTEDDVRAIRANWRRGKRLGEWTSTWIARRYNIEQSGVRKIAAGLNWKYVTS